MTILMENSVKELTLSDQTATLDNRMRVCPPVLLQGVDRFLSILRLSQTLF